MYYIFLTTQNAFLVSLLGSEDKNDESYSSPVSKLILSTSEVQASMRRTPREDMGERGIPVCREGKLAHVTGPVVRKRG